MDVTSKCHKHIKNAKYQAVLTLRPLQCPMLRRLAPSNSALRYLNATAAISDL